jgi:flagellar biosynthesis protein FlhG
VAKRFMQIELEFFGAIPKDEHLSKAAKLGRSVIDAFPMAVASAALQKIAQRLDYKHEQFAADYQRASYI